MAQTDSTSIPIHLDQVPGTLVNVLARLTQARIAEINRVDFLTAYVNARCQRCQTKLSALDLLRLGSGAQAETVGDERLARVLRGYCANDGCQSYYYLFSFRPHAAIDWSSVEGAVQAAPAEAQLDRDTQAEIDRRLHERRAARRRSLVRAVLGLLLLLLLLLARWWQMGKAIPVLREPRKFTVAPQPVAPALPPDPARPVVRVGPAAAAPEVAMTDPELPDLTKIKPDPDVKKKK
ncbi:MAG: hypothetical protein EBS05_06265 [Proteobacteria bacterium]|nr:hypothetical protein [Pseudomonadota bacterium]